MDQTEKAKPERVVSRSGELIRKSREILQTLPNPVEAFAKLKHLLGYRRTLPMPREDKAEERPYETVDSGRLRTLINRGQFYEGPIPSNIIQDRLANIDRIMFEKDGKTYHQGWRNEEVHVGAYLPPLAQNVPTLMDSFAQKASDLWFQVDNHNQQEMTRYTAWCLWTLINIHPKTDGNGRFSKALAEVLLPTKEVLGTRLDVWDNVFLLSDGQMMEEISRRSNRPLPDIPDEPEGHEEYKEWMIKYSPTLSEFYHPQGHDYPAEILQSLIDQTRVSETGKFLPAGLSTEVFELLVEFLNKVPDKQTPQARRA